MKSSVNAISGAIQSIGVRCPESTPAEVRCVSTRRSGFIRARKGSALAALLVMAMFSPLVDQVRAQTPRTPWRTLTQSQLSSVWWQWLFSVPVSGSPVFDTTGASAYNGQPYGDLMFLGGTFIVNQLVNGDVRGEVTRYITIRKGTALFFPLLNSEWDHVGLIPHLGATKRATAVLSVPEMQALIKVALDQATGLYSTLTPTDGTFTTAVGAPAHLAYPRLQGPPFSFMLPATDNLYQSFGYPVSGAVAPAVSDGFFSYIPGTLAPGYYLLEFGGTQPANDQGNLFTEAITYKITVTQ